MHQLINPPCNSVERIFYIEPVILPCIETGLLPFVPWKMAQVALGMSSGLLYIKKVPCSILVQTVPLLYRKA
jgi:hypothetical protein